MANEEASAQSVTIKVCYRVNLEEETEGAYGDVI